MTVTTLTAYTGDRMISNAATTNSDFATQAANAGYLGERNDAAQVNRWLLKYAGLSDGTIPAVAIITDVKLYLYINADVSSNARVCDVFRSLRAWSASQATWNVYTSGNSWTTGGAGSAGNDYDSASLGTASFTATESTGAYKTFTLTPSLIQNYVNATWANNGFVLRFQTETDDAYRFNVGVSSEANLPYMEVTWSYGVTAAQGAYTYTGQTANLLFSHLVSAVQGAYTYTGQVASLLAARILSAAQGSYVYTGQSITAVVMRLVITLYVLSVDVSKNISHISTSKNTLSSDMSKNTSKRER